MTLTKHSDWLKQRPPICKIAATWLKTVISTTAKLHTFDTDFKQKALGHIILLASICHRLRGNRGEFKVIVQVANPSACVRESDLQGDV